VKQPADIKILIVEDDPFFQRVLQKRVAGEGYQVAMAADGREGMKSIVTFEPDLVISDWMMPEVDGLELCQSVKTGLKEAAPYFILLTAKGEVNNKLLGLETGADDYLVKPCDPGELMARVRAGLRIVLLNQDLRQAVGQLQMSNAELVSTRDAMKRLADRLLLCSVCHKVRDGDSLWLYLDEYLKARGRMEFSHGLCPGCKATHYPNQPPGDQRVA
jgi:sigma-B regulation protein RsbU (phosphoserine phosphatase)